MKITIHLLSNWTQFKSIQSIQEKSRNLSQRKRWTYYFYCKTSRNYFTEEQLFKRQVGFKNYPMLDSPFHLTATIIWSFGIIVIIMKLLEFARNEFLKLLLAETEFRDLQLSNLSRNPMELIRLGWKTKCFLVWYWKFLPCQIGR